MINKVGRFCLAKGVKFVWLFQGAFHQKKTDKILSRFLVEFVV